MTHRPGTPEVNLLATQIFRDQSVGFMTLLRGCRKSGSLNASLLFPPPLGAPGVGRVGWGHSEHFVITALFWRCACPHPNLPPEGEGVVLRHPLDAPIIPGDTGVLH